MKVSFVIPAFNEELNIGNCLAAIQREIRLNDCAAEVVVVDNASTDQTAEIARHFPNIKVVSEPHKGIVHARARGFEESTGELVANIDADNVLPEGWLRTVLQEFREHPALVCLSGPLVYRDLSSGQRFLVDTFYRMGFLLYLLNRYILRMGSMVQGGNFILKRDAWLSVGGFNTAIQFYGEDTDIARRLYSAGEVKFTFQLPIYSSGRRLADEGVFRTGARYALNYFWVIFFKRPYHTSSRDIRTTHKS